MADKYRHLAFNKGCPVVLVVLIVEGEIEMVTKFLLLKSDCYVYAFFVGGSWKCFNDCPYILVINENNDCAEKLPFDSHYIDDSYGDIAAKDIYSCVCECHYGNDSFRSKLLKLVVIFVEGAKFYRIHYLVSRVLCATHDNSKPIAVSLPRRDFLLFTSWGRLCESLYIFISEGRWKLSAAIVKKLELPTEQDKQLKECLNSVLIINRPCIQLITSEFNFQKLVFEFTVNFDDRNLLVAEYDHIVDLIRSLADGGTTVLDVTRPFIFKIKLVDGGCVVSKCSFLVSRENYEFCCIKLGGKWYNFFQSPYDLKNEAKEKIKRLDYFSFNFRKFSEFSLNALVTSLYDIQSGSVSQMHSCSLFYFIFFGGSIFPEIQAFVRSVFLECAETDIVHVSDYHVKLLSYWQELSYFLRNVKEKKQKKFEFHLRPKLSNELNLPRYTENEEVEVRRRVAIIHC